MTSIRRASIRLLGTAGACAMVLAGAVWTSHTEAPEAVVQVKPVDCGGSVGRDCLPPGEHHLSSAPDPGNAPPSATIVTTRPGPTTVRPGR
ncbi:hypothetical protein [Mycobacteroides salmoniphilum]|uniref:hypothetical protein n=1 Tax=Mycobacteroides salmoniphilum TaxID=404941 RepID=UPI0010652221|nr:hypothetical protein [Mycobacteroides salmoniphilum]